MITYDVFGDDIKTCLDSTAISQSVDVTSINFNLILAKVLNEKINKALTIKVSKGISQFSDDLIFLDKKKLQDILNETTSMNASEYIEIDPNDLQSLHYATGIVLESINFIKANYIPLIHSNNSEEILTEGNNRDDINSLSLLTKEKIYLPENKPDIDFAKQMNQKLDLINKSSEPIFMATKGEGIEFSEVERKINQPISETKFIEDPDNLTKSVFKNPENKRIELSDVEISINRSTLETKNTEVSDIFSKDEMKGLLDKNNNLFNTKDYLLVADKDAEFLLQARTSDNQQETDEPNNYLKKEPIPAKNTPFPETLSGFINKNTIIEPVISKQRVVPIELPDIDGDRLQILEVNDTTFRVAVESDGVGMLDIELTLEKGIINAHILASESAGKHFLDNNLSSILSNLLKEGLNIGRFSVSLGDKRNDTPHNNEDDKGKDSKVLEKMNLKRNYNQNQLISIFA